MNVFSFAKFIIEVHSFGVRRVVMKYVTHRLAFSKFIKYANVRFFSHDFCLYETCILIVVNQIVVHLSHFASSSILYYSPLCEQRTHGCSWRRKARHEYYSFTIWHPNTWIMKWKQINLLHTSRSRFIKARIESRPSSNIKIQIRRHASQNCQTECVYSWKSKIKCVAQCVAPIDIWVVRLTDYETNTKKSANWPIMSTQQFSILSLF